MRLELGHADALGVEQPQCFFTSSWRPSSWPPSSPASSPPPSLPSPSSPCCPPSLSEWRDQNSAGANRRCTALDSYSEMKKTANLLKKRLTPKTSMGRAFPQHDALAAVRVALATADRRWLPMQAVASKKCLFHAGFLPVEKFCRHLHHRAPGVARTTGARAAAPPRRGCGQSKNSPGGIGRGKRVGPFTRSHSGESVPSDSGDWPPIAACSPRRRRPSRCAIE